MANIKLGKNECFQFLTDILIMLKMEEMGVIWTQNQHLLTFL